MEKKYKTLRSLKKGTRYLHVTDSGKEMIAVAGNKRGKYEREFIIEGDINTTYLQYSDITVVTV